MKRICLVIPSLRNGGAERVISELANLWSANNVLKIYLVILAKQKHFYAIDERVVIIEPDRAYKATPIGRFFYKLWVLLFIRSTYKKIKPDTLLSFCEIYNNIVLLSLFFTSGRKFVSDRNSPYNNIGTINNWLRNKLYRKATGIVAQTDTAKTILRQNTRNKNVIVIPNPLREIRDYKTEVKTDSNIILNVGRNVPQKNQIELIKIFHKCNMNNWTLKILGDGPLRSELQNTITELQLENNVYLIDFNADIDKYYSEAKIFAFTSIFEGFPNALSEAMAHGLACVSYDCPTGPRDMIVDGENGFLIPLNEQDIYVEKFKLLMSSDKLRLKFRESAIKHKIKFDMKNIADKYLSFILN